MTTMSDEELKQLAADTLRSIGELREGQRETDRLFKEVGRRMEELAEQSARETAALRESQAETDRQLRESRAETDRQLRETDQWLKESRAETDRQLRETDRRLTELGRQLGGLGDKFGSFTEGMAFPSMKKLLEERFGADHVTLRSIARLNGRSHEVDVLAYANGDRGAVYVVEVKSHLREEGLEQILRLLRDFSQFYPEHRGKRLYGILAAVDVPGDLRDKVLREGIYLAQISGDTFALQVPASFAPRSFQ